MFVKFLAWPVALVSLALLSACGGGDVDAGHGVQNDAAPAARDPAQDGTRLLSASVPLQAGEPAIYLHGEGAAVVAGALHLPDAPRITPVVAVVAVDAHEHMALADLAFEQSFSLEMSRRHAASRQPEEAAALVQQAYLPHDDCVDPYQDACTVIHRIARQDDEL